MISSHELLCCTAMFRLLAAFLSARNSQFCDGNFFI